MNLERKRSQDSSFALWIPTTWLILNGSKPLSYWFNYGVGGDETGSPLDRLVLTILIILALIVLARKRIDYSRILKDNSVICFTYIFLFISTLWTDEPFIAFKRWVRIAGTIPIALVFLTEKKPFASFESALRRCAYVLIPFSIVLIKYFPYIGVAYGRWDGKLMWIGVGMQKNGFGAFCAISFIFMLWTIIRDLRAGKLFTNKCMFFTDVFVSGIALFIVIGPGDGRSATALSVTILGIMILVLLYRMKNIIIWVAEHVKLVIVTLVVMFTFFIQIILPELSSILGRDVSLTGRTDIWQAALSAARVHPILGYGYGGFWGLPDNPVTAICDVKSAHNGYLDVYLEVGTFGLLFLIIFLLSCCTKVKNAFDYSTDWGIFGFSMLIMLLIMNYTESFFFQTGYTWTSIMCLAITCTYTEKHE